MRASRENAKPSLMRRALACLVSAAMVVAFTPVVAWGDPATSGVKYLDWDDTNKKLVETSYTGEYTVITSDYIRENSYTLKTGWYVATGEAAVDGFSVNGDAHLILENGCTLTANPYVARGNKLTIYAQSEDEATMGTLIASSVSSNPGIGSGGAVTINGGTIKASGWEDAGIGGGGKEDYDGVVTINGGVVTATSSLSAGIGGGTKIGGCGGGTVTINGGIVTAYMFIKVSTGNNRPAP
ncbi:MAG: hypothetical protein ACI36Y_08675, partial [Coriobacteriales bacterium]